MVTFLVEIKFFKTLLGRYQWRSNDLRLYCNVPGRDQMLYGSIVTFLVEIKCSKAILNIPCGDQLI